MILVICILGYKVQSIMCATNSIFGLKERINSSNSPSAFKGLKRRTQKKEKLSQEPGKNVICFTEGLYQQYLKIAQHDNVLQTSSSQYQLQFFLLLGYSFLCCTALITSTATCSSFWLETKIS